MPVFKNEDNGTWYVMARYVNWKGERKQKCKRGFATKREAQEWERMFKLQTSSDLDMSFEAFRYGDIEKLWNILLRISRGPGVDVAKVALKELLESSEDELDIIRYNHLLSEIQINEYIDMKAEEFEENYGYEQNE